MQRRRLLTLSVTGLILGAMPRLVFAQDAGGDAAAFINAFAQKGIIEVLNAKVSQQEKGERFRVLFKQFFDIPAIARFTVGRFWKMGQPEEQTKFLTAFEDVIVYTWSRRFSEYDGQTLQVQNTAPDGADGAVVNSKIVGKDTQPVAVAWRVRKRAEGWRVVDVIVEGVSMAVTYRQEYAGILAQQGGFPGLVTQLQTQASDLARQQNKTG
jgi:phospholipid transport system substrate-binding protein